MWEEQVQVVLLLSAIQDEKMLKSATPFLIGSFLCEFEGAKAAAQTFTSIFFILDDHEDYTYIY